MSGKEVMILSIFDIIWKFSGKKQQIHVLGIVIDPDPDAAKIMRIWTGSGYTGYYYDLTYTSETILEKKFIRKCRARDN